MKRVLNLIVPTIVCLSVSHSATAANADAGEKIFTSNCVACHSNGSNVIAPEKTLKKSSLEKNGKFSPQAIINQVTNGKSPMPAFGNSLSADDIENVAAFVLKKANADWK